MRSIRELFMVNEAVVANIDGYVIDKKSPSEFVVKKGENEYTVQKSSSGWTCSCPSFKFSGKKTCKHIQMLLDNDLIIKQERLPMNLIDDVVIPALDPVVSKYVPEWEKWIVGSYRRQKDTFKDIDVIIPLDKDEFADLADELSQVEGFTPVMKGPDIFRGMFPVDDTHKVELDFSRQNTGSQAGMLLYRSGPASFNQAMRRVAMAKGWSLSEKGLVDHETGELVDVPQDTEEEIFAALGIPYLTPPEREYWEEFIDIDSIIRDQRDSTSSNRVIGRLTQWFKEHPEWEAIGQSLDTKDNVAALKGRLMGSSKNPKGLITDIVKSPYKYEIQRAYKNAYGKEIV